MSRSNYNKPFYVDVGTSIVAIRCASNHDVIVGYDYVRHPLTLELAQAACDRMNKEAEIGRPLRNCDVGTVEEQKERFNKFCTEHTDPMDIDGWQCDKKCPLYKNHPDCQFAWAQMPY